MNLQKYVYICSFLAKVYSISIAGIIIQAKQPPFGTRNNKIINRVNRFLLVSKSNTSFSSFGNVFSSVIFFSRRFCQVAEFSQTNNLTNCINIYYIYWFLYLKKKKLTTCLTRVISLSLSPDLLKYAYFCTFKCYQRLQRCDQEIRFALHFYFVSVKYRKNFEIRIWQQICIVYIHTF